MNIFELVNRYFPYLYAVRKRAILTGALVLTEPLVAVALIWLGKELTDQVLVGRKVDLLPIFAAAFIGVSGLKVGLDYATTRLEASVVESIFQAIRIDLYRHLLRVSPGSLGKRSVGDLLAHLSDDVERMELLVFTGIIAVVSDLATVVFFVIFLSVLSWKLTLCALLVLPILVFASLRLSPRVRRAARIGRHRATAWMSLSEERLGAAAIIHSFGAQETEVRLFSARLDVARAAELRTVRIQAWLSVVIETAVAVGGLLVFTLGAYEILYGNLTLGTLVAFAGSIGSLYDPARGLAKASGRFQRGAAAAQRVGDLFDTPSLVVERPSAPPLVNVKGALEFRDVHFAYQRGTEVIKGISLKTEPGEMLAVVGPSGSGKSTLVQLAQRLYDPSEGAVLLDGQDLREVTTESVRRAVAVVFQEAFLFRGTIADNIRCGEPDAPEERVSAMGRAAYVDSFLAGRPGGYNAPVGSRGAWLSAGQRQRVGLARALMRDAPLLILDEATASVDTETEELIQDAVERFAGRQTILVIAHRLSSIQRADRVVVVDQGRVVETGSPTFLLQTASRCRDLFAAQLIGEKAVA